MADDTKNEAEVHQNNACADERYSAHHVMKLANLGTLNVFIQGTRSKNEVVILTVHDLGCNHTMFHDFVSNPRMQAIRDRTLWVHVVLPGQEPNAEDLPAGFAFPSMQNLGENLIHILDRLDIKEVVCFGEGAGANVLSRFAMTHNDRVLGLCLLHCTGTTAGFMESLKDKMISWKLDHIGMNPTAEAYLVLHRFGSVKPEFHQAEDQDQLKAVIENYQDHLRTKINAKNLRKFVEQFLKRTNIMEHAAKLRCQTLLVTGGLSVFSSTTRNMHQAILKTTTDKAKVEFITMHGVANVLEEKPEKMVDCFQYFLQGLGLVSSVPMPHVGKPFLRMRSMSMEEYDLPKLRTRSQSGGSTSPTSASPAHQTSHQPSVPEEQISTPSSPTNNPLEVTTK